MTRLRMERHVEHVINVCQFRRKRKTKLLRKIKSLKDLQCNQQAFAPFEQRVQDLRRAMGYPNSFYFRISRHDFNKIIIPLHQLVSIPNQIPLESFDKGFERENH